MIEKLFTMQIHRQQHACFHSRGKCVVHVCPSSHTQTHTHTHRDKSAFTTCPVQQALKKDRWVARLEITTVSSGWGKISEFVRDVFKTHLLHYK